MRETTTIRGCSETVRFGTAPFSRLRGTVSMSDLDEVLPPERGTTDSPEEYHEGKIYCANCTLCKIVTVKPENEKGDEHYLLRIRCVAGKWKKRLGEEKLYKYCTVLRRFQDSCDAYDSMGEPEEYIRELKKSLPNKDELYNYTASRPG
jgi:hypothetical protein